MPVATCQHLGQWVRYAYHLIVNGSVVDQWVSSPVQYWDYAFAYGAIPDDRPDYFAFLVNGSVAERAGWALTLSAYFEGAISICLDPYYPS